MDKMEKVILELNVQASKLLELIQWDDKPEKQALEHGIDVMHQQLDELKLLIDKTN